MKARYGVVVVALLAGMLPGSLAVAAGELEVVFLEAAHGDTVLYRGPCGEVGLIDANRGAVDEVLGQLDAWGSRGQLSWIAVSHYDADHLGDVQDVGTAAGIDLEAVYDRGGERTVKDTATYRNYYDWVTTSGLRRPVDIGDRFELCGTVVFDVVSAGTDGTAAGGVPVSEENDRSVCVAVAYGAFDLASCGDVNQAVEEAAAAAYGDVEVVKVSHHGSATSSAPAYINTLSAEVAVLTVGANSYGHPTSAVVQRWAASGATLFQTGNPDGTRRDGDVTVTAADTGAFTVAGQSGRSYTTATTTPPPSSAPTVQPIAPACEDAPAGRFPDVAGTHQPGIDCISWWGIAEGTNAGTYRPAQGVRRDQMASFMARTLDQVGNTLRTSGPDAFTDDNGSAHEPAIDRLAAAGIVQGTGAARYSPARTVTRGQMAAYLARTWHNATGSPLPAGRDAFADDNGSTHEDAINQIAAAGITAGTRGGGYDPTGPVTRDQMGTFIARLLAHMVEDGAAPYPPPNPRPLPPPTSPTGPGSMPDGTFANCTEAREAGAAPVHRGDPGYHSRLDRDGDGIGCE